jgi:hypothetical protein
MFDGDFTSSSMVALLVSLIVSALLIFQIWKRPDPTYFKVLLGCIGLIPFFGPLCLLWTLVMPERMPSELQAKYAEKMNSYSSHGFSKLDEAAAK